MKPYASNKLLRGVTLGVIISIIVSAVFLSGGFIKLEGLSFDLRAWFLARPARTTPEISLILVDQESLNWVLEEQGYSWPWPRTIYGTIIEFLNRHGAKAVIFDLILTDPSTYGVADDEYLGERIQQYGKFVAGSVTLSHETGRNKWPENDKHTFLNIQGYNKWKETQHPEGLIFPKAVFPIDEVYESSLFIANVMPPPPSDGIYRSIQFFFEFDEKIVPSLTLGAFLAANPDTKLAVYPNYFQIGNKKIPIDAHGNAVLRFRGPSHTHTTVPALAVIQSELRLQEGKKPVIDGEKLFKDKYVFLGVSALGLMDLRPSAIDRKYPGVQIHVTALDNLLANDFIQKVPQWITVSFIFFLLITLSLSKIYTDRLSITLFIILFFTIFPFLAGFGAYQFGFWLPIAVIELGVIICIPAVFGEKFIIEGREKRFIKSTFKQYLNPAVIEQLLKNPERLKLGGEQRTLSIFFSDLQGFTSISERLTPEALTALLNEYLTAMTDIVQDEEKGTVDKYEGDAIIAFWNAPIDLPDHAIRAVRAALNCQKKLAEMRPVIKAQIGKELHMRIGLNTGDAMVGNFGSRTKFDYTMLGDAVNLAARLEEINKQFKTYTMISQATRDLLGDEFAFRKLGRIAVVGRKEPVTIYEPMFKEEFEVKRDLYNIFDQGLGHFFQGNFLEAKKIFETIADQDGAALSYINKCEDLAQTPPETWNGVWVATSK